MPQHTHQSPPQFDDITLKPEDVKPSYLAVRTGSEAILDAFDTLVTRMQSALQVRELMHGNHVSAEAGASGDLMFIHLALDAKEEYTRAFDAVAVEMIEQAPEYIKSAVQAEMAAEEAAKEARQADVLDSVAPNPDEGEGVPYPEEEKARGESLADADSDLGGNAA